MKSLQLQETTIETIYKALDTRIQMCAKFETETRFASNQDGAVDALERHAHWVGECDKARIALREFQAVDRGGMYAEIYSAKAVAA